MTRPTATGTICVHSGTPATFGTQSAPMAPEHSESQPLGNAETPSLFSAIEVARRPIQDGQPIVLIDDCVPEGASAVIAAAGCITDSAVNLLSRLSGGLIQIAISPSRAATLMLHPLRSRHETTPSPLVRATAKEEWLVSVEARHGVGSGISIADRRTTIRLIGSDDPQPGTLARPGHLFPCRCHPGGVIARAALPEAALDLVSGFGMTDAAVFSYLLDASGEIASPAGARAFATEHGIPTVTLSTILSWRLRHERLIEEIASSELPTLLGGELRMHVFRSLVDSSEQVALVKGVIDPHEPTLVRVHVEEPIDDLIGLTDPSERTSSRGRLDAALRCLDDVPRGVLVYLRPALQRAALSTRMLQDNSLPLTETSPATTTSSMMEFGIGAQILRALGVEAVTILCRTKRPYEILELFGLRVVGYRQLERQ